MHAREPSCTPDAGREPPTPAGRERSPWLDALLRGCLLAVLLSVLVASAFPGSASALSPTLGRWSGGGPGGSVQFVVSRVGGTLVLSDVVVSCAAAVGAAEETGTPNWDEEAIRPNGRIFSFSDPPALVGKLKSASGRVTADGTIADLSLTNGEAGRCSDAGLRNVHVAPSHATVVTDGSYTVTGLLGTYGTATVYGEGALLQYDMSLATPVGGGEDDPEACLEGGFAASSSSQTVLLGPSGSFSAETAIADIFIEQATLSGQFTSPTSAVGAYSASFIDGDAVDCTGAGAFALTLASAAPALEPLRAPKRAPSTPPAEANRCAMRFQIQQGKATPHSEPVHRPQPITVAEADAGLDRLRSQVPRRMDEAADAAFAETRRWLLARPQHGGVDATGNVKRAPFEYKKRRWRLDTENLRCHNLRR